MARRIDENELDFDVKELHAYPIKNVIASVENSRVQAEVEALKIRLAGKPAHVQNGMQGKYEVLATERKSELRELNATFTELGAGIYRAGNPSWDKGSLWTIYKMGEDGSIILSRMEDEDEETREALTASLIKKSNVRGKTAGAVFLHKVGELIEFVDSQGRFATGTVLDVDQYARHYVVQSDISFEKEWIPFNLTAADEAFTSEDAGADDDFEFEPEAHSEDAYTSEDSSADDDYSQNEEDVAGFESMDKFDNVTASNQRKAEEVAFDHDMNMFGLDDMYQLPEDLQESEDHYGFDDDLYATASATEDSGDDDMVQPVEDLQDEQGEEDQHFERADDMQNQVGDSVDADSFDLNELMEVQRDQFAKYQKPERDIWLI